MIHSGSDYHLLPGDEFPDDLISLQGHLVMNEIFEIIPIGFDAWQTAEGRHTVDSFANRLPPQGCDMVLSNHDGRQVWLKKVVKDHTQIRVHQTHEIIEDGKCYHFEHGHRFTDWLIWSWAADDVVHFLTGWNKYLREGWYEFCRWIGWMHPEGGIPGESTESQWVRAYWGMVMNQAMKTNKTYVVGHSHIKETIHSRRSGVSMWDTGCGQIVRIA